MSAAPEFPTFAFGHFLLDSRRRLLHAGGQTVNLQPRAFDLLSLLVASTGQVVARTDLLKAGWPGVSVSDANVTVQISNLRRVLASHGGADLIVTVGRGYRFTAEVRRIEAAPSLRPTGGVRLGALAGMALAALAGAGLWWALPRLPLRLPAHVRVETRPDTVTIAPGGYQKVDYVFTVAEPVDLQLESEDVQFFLPSGRPVGTNNIGGRILHGSFAITGGAGIYHNNIYLPPDVAQAGLAAGGMVQLRHEFHLKNPRGAEFSIPAVLEVIVAAPGRPAASPAQAAAALPP